MNFRRARASARMGSFAGVAATLVACHRKPPPRADEAAPAPKTVASAALETSGLASIVQGMATADLRVEARRGILSASDALVAAHRAELEEHFQGSVPYPLAFQAVATGNGRTAVLVQATSGEARPLVWFFDSAGALGWTKEHPIGGVKPGVTEPSLAPGPDGRVSLAWCNGSTSSVALRQWTDDGGAFADYEALHFDACDALSILFWPHHGWILGVASATGLVLQLVSENGGLEWGRDGTPLPWTHRGTAPASFALDTQDSFMLFRLGTSGGGGPNAPDYVFAARYAPDAHPLWPGPLSVKRLPTPVREAKTRIVLEPTNDAAIRARVPAQALGATEDAVVEVAPDGTVTRR